MFITIRDHSTWQLLSFNFTLQASFMLFSSFVLFFQYWIAQHWAHYHLNFIKFQIRRSYSNKAFISNFSIHHKFFIFIFIAIVCLFSFAKHDRYYFLFHSKTFHIGKKYIRCAWSAWNCELFRPASLDLMVNSSKIFSTARLLS